MLTGSRNVRAILYVSKTINYMETIIQKRVKGSSMEWLFDNSTDLLMVKFFTNLSLKDDEEFDGSKYYRYKITLRHPEGTDANELFNEAISKAPVSISGIDFNMLKKQKAELVRLQFYPEKYNLNKKQVDAITGITNLIDAIQEAAK